MRADALAHVVDDENRDGVTALHLAQETEQSRDIGAAVFVQAMESHQGIEQQELGPPAGERRIEALLVALQIEPHGRRRDDVKVESCEIEAAMGTEGAEALADTREGVLGEVDEGRASVVDGEAIETRGTRRDAEGDVEPEETLRALRLSAAEANGLLSPHIADEPVSAGLEGGQIACTHDGKLAVIVRVIAVVWAHGKMAFRAEAI
jgi:hypothetical protein